MYSNVTIRFLGFTLVRININITNNWSRKFVKNNVEYPFSRFRTTLTGDPIDRKKRKKNSMFEIWSGTRCKKRFDDTMSELRLRQNIYLCPLKKQLPLGR
jgi:hypothetical protein